MRMLMRFDGTYLAPTSEHDFDEFKSLKRGEYLVTIKKARNPGFHRKGMKLLSVMHENWPGDAIQDFDDFRHEMLLHVGFVHSYTVPKTGDVRVRVKSMSFAEMDDLTFEKLYSKLLTVAAKTFGDDFADQFA